MKPKPEKGSKSIVKSTQIKEKIDMNCLLNGGWMECSWWVEKNEKGNINQITLISRAIHFALSCRLCDSCSILLWLCVFSFAYCSFVETKSIDTQNKTQNHHYFGYACFFSRWECGLIGKCFGIKMVHAFPFRMPLTTDVKQECNKMLFMIRIWVFFLFLVVSVAFFAFRSGFARFSYGGRPQIITIIIVDSSSRLFFYTILTLLIWMETYTILKKKNTTTTSK